MAKTRTLETILAQIEQLRAEAEAIRQKERPEVIAHLKELIHLYEIPDAHLSVAAAGGRIKQSERKSALPPLYKDPASGATWTGRGPAPSWIRDASDRSAFSINGPAKEEPQSQLSVTSTVATGTRKTAGRTQVAQPVAPLKATPRKVGSPKGTNRVARAARS